MALIVLQGKVRTPYLQYTGSCFSSKPGKKWFENQTGEMSLDSLPLPDLFHLISFLQPKDLISLKSSCSKFRRILPNPKKRTLKINLLIKPKQFIKDFNFLLQSSLDISLVLPILRKDLSLYKTLDRLVQRLARDGNDRIVEIEILGESTVDTLLEICPKLGNISKLSCCVSDIETRNFRLTYNTLEQLGEEALSVKTDILERLIENNRLKLKHLELSKPFFNSLSRKITKAKFPLLNYVIHHGCHKDTNHFVYRSFPFNMFEEQ